MKRRSSSSMKGEKQLTLWVYSVPSKLYLIPEDKTNPVTKLKEFIGTTFQHSEEEYILATLTPGSPYPIPVMRFASGLDHGINLCLPKRNIKLKVQYRDEALFHIPINPLRTIGDLKAIILKEKGHSPSQQELLSNGHALHNDGLILDYGLQDGSKLNLFIQPSRPFSITVETFWKSTYTIAINSCMTIQEIQKRILRKAFSFEIKSLPILEKSKSYDKLVQCSFHEKVLSKSAKANTCGIKKDSPLQFLSSSESRKDNFCMVEVHMPDDDDPVEIPSATYDTWFIIALRLHGKLKLPVNQMSFVVQNKKLEFEDTVGGLKDFELNSSNIVCVELLLPECEENDDFINFMVKLPSGIKESIKLPSSSLVKDIKKCMLNIGYESIQYHDLYHRHAKLHENTQLSDCKLSERSQVEAKLNTFPVTIQEGCNTKKLTLSPDMFISSLTRKIEASFNCSSVTTSMLYAGKDLYQNEKHQVSNMFIYIKSRLFLEPVSTNQSLHLVVNNEVIPLQIKQKLDTIQLSHLDTFFTELDSFIEALQWFLKWRFPDRNGFHTTLGKEKTKVNKPIIRLHSSITNPNKAMLAFPQEIPKPQKTDVDKRAKAARMLFSRGSSSILHKRDQNLIHVSPRLPPSATSSGKFSLGSGRPVLPLLVESRGKSFMTSLPELSNGEKPKSLLRNDKEPSKKKLSVRFNIPNENQEEELEEGKKQQRERTGGVGHKYTAGSFWRDSKVKQSSNFTTQRLHIKEDTFSSLRRNLSDLSLSRFDRDGSTALMHTNKGDPLYFHRK